MLIHLYNSLEKKVAPFAPLQGNTVRMYSCGPTVYNYAHIGNMRAFLFADLLQRALRVVGGYDVDWVMNITNIDDKTIRDSAVGSQAWLPDMGSQSGDLMDNLMKLTNFYEKSFLDDISILGIDKNHFLAMPKATDFVWGMQELIKIIVDKGIAYISEGSVYFNVTEWRKQDFYGKLFKIDFDNFKPGTRIDSDQYEREQASDFALWKTKKENEPYWEFELNGQKCDGRPGWHIECSVMEKELLGLPFDIHTGGVDLKFPHHEDEIAQSKAGYGIEPTAFWCHNEFLEVEGEKMSKSLGNFFTVRDLLAKGIDPLDIRYLMFSSHYSSVLNFTFDGLAATHKARQRVQDYIYDLFGADIGNWESGIGTGKKVLDLKDKVFSELANDLHTPMALGAIFSFINNNPVKELNLGEKAGLLYFFKELNGVFAVWEIAERKAVALQIPQNVIELADKRLQARRDKNFAMSDTLRDEIKSFGFIIKDAKDSYSLEKM